MYTSIFDESLSQIDDRAACLGRIGPGGTGFVRYPHDDVERRVHRDTGIAIDSDRNGSVGDRRVDRRRRR